MSDNVVNIIETLTLVGGTTAFTYGGFLAGTQIYYYFFKTNPNFMQKTYTGILNFINDPKGENTSEEKGEIVTKIATGIVTFSIALIGYFIIIKPFFSKFKNKTITKKKNKERIL